MINIATDCMWVQERRPKTLVIAGTRAKLDNKMREIEENLFRGEVSKRHITSATNSLFLTDGRIYEGMVAPKNADWFRGRKYDYAYVDGGLPCRLVLEIIQPMTKGDMKWF